MTESDAVELLEDEDGAPFPDEVQAAHRVALAEAFREVAAEVRAVTTRDDPPLSAGYLEACAAEVLAGQGRTTTLQDVQAEAQRLREELDASRIPRLERMARDANASAIVQWNRADAAEAKLQLAEDGLAGQREVIQNLAAEEVKLRRQLEELRGAAITTSARPVLTVRDVPVVPFPGGSSQADFYRSAAQHVLGGYLVGGSNLTRAVGTLLHRVADMLDAPDVPALDVPCDAPGPHPSWIPCQRLAGHDGDHASTSGCAGGQARWPRMDRCEMFTNPPGGGYVCYGCGRGWWEHPDEARPARLKGRKL